MDDSGSESEPEVGEIGEKDRNQDTGLPRPDAFTREHKDDPKMRKLKISSKFLSHHEIR